MMSHFANAQIHHLYLGTRYNWEKTDDFNPKITAKQLVKNILRTLLTNLNSSS